MTDNLYKPLKEKVGSKFDEPLMEEDTEVKLIDPQLRTSG